MSNQAGDDGGKYKIEIFKIIVMQIILLVCLPRFHKKINHDQYTVTTEPSRGAEL